MPAPFAMPCRGSCGACGTAGVPGAVWSVWAGLLGAPVGGGPPASRPRRELRSARRLEARPGPATAHIRRSLAPRRPPIGRGVGVLPGQALPPPTGTVARPSIVQDSHPVVTSHVPEPRPNFACNSPTTPSNFEIRSLELQRFQTLLKLHLIELHASFLRGGRMGAAGGVAGARKPGVWLSETGDAFAGR